MQKRYKRGRDAKRKERNKALWKLCAKTLQEIIEVSKFRRSAREGKRYGTVEDVTVARSTIIQTTVKESLGAIAHLVNFNPNTLSFNTAG